jgi:hypothetical protein
LLVGTGKTHGKQTKNKKSERSMFVNHNLRIEALYESLSGMMQRGSIPLYTAGVIDGMAKS